MSMDTIGPGRSIAGPASPVTPLAAQEPAAFATDQGDRAVLTGGTTPAPDPLRAAFLKTTQPVGDTRVPPDDHVFEVADATFNDFVHNSRFPVMLEFFNPTWKNCTVFAPWVSKLSNEYEGRLTVGHIDVRDNPQTTNEYGVKITPTTLFFRAGQPVKTLPGYMKYEDLKAQTDGVLAEPAPPAPAPPGPAPPAG
jgi:thioredoxin 1